MPEIKDRFSFEPNHNARSLWLGTRKSETPCGYFTLPGFYKTVDIGKDTGWFIMGLVIEAVAFSLTIYGGLQKGGVMLLGAGLASILFLVLDYVGFVWYHSNVENICLCRNNIKIVQPSQRPAWELRMKDGKIKKAFGFIFLVLSSSLKIGSVLLLTSINLVLLIILAIFYIIVIYIHSSHTGFWFSEFNTDRQFRKQHKRWAAGDVIYNARILPSVIVSALPLNNIPINIGGHSITFVNQVVDGGQTYYHYTLQTTGILEDTDITYLTAGQLPQQAGIIAEACLRHQVTVIHP